MSEMVDVVSDALRPFMGELTEAASAARDALTAIEAAGYRVVPVEPTREMKAAAKKKFGASSGFTDAQVWRTMLAAAPKVTA